MIILTHTQVAKQITLHTNPVPKTEHHSYSEKETIVFDHDSSLVGP